MKCNDCGNTKSLITFWLDTALEHYDEDGNNIDTESVGYENMSDGENWNPQCGECNSENVES